MVSTSYVCAQNIAVLDFDFGHGTVLDTQYTSLGVTISVDATKGTTSGGDDIGQDIAIVYDSELGGTNGASINGADPDLERLNPNNDNTGDWDGGNLGANYNAGGLLIIQENPEEATAPTYGSGVNQITSASNYDPDDSELGGTVTFDLDTAFGYRFFNVTLADFEEDGDNYTTKLYGTGGVSEIFSFANFTDPDPGNPFFDPTITSGDNHINELPEISLSTGEVLTKVEITFNESSGSISNIIFSENPVPEPSSITLLGLGGLALLIRRKR